MVQKNDVGLKLFLAFNILGDLQLTFFSWNQKVFDPTTSFNVIQYIFNPLHYVVEKITPAAYIIAFVLFIFLSILLGVCTDGLSKGRLKLIWPLQSLRMLTYLSLSFLSVPFLYVLAYPCGPCQNDWVPGFDKVLKCDSGLRFAVYGASGIGVIFLILFYSTMTSLFFDPSPRSRIGKSSGRVDFLNIMIRVVMVVVNVFAPKIVSTIVNCVLLLVLCLFMLYQQPFYEAIFNRVRFAQFFSAFVVSLCAVAAAFTNLDTLPLSAHVTFTAATLALGFIALPVGFYFNIYFFNSMCRGTYQRLQDELAYQKEARRNDVRVHKSQLELIYSNMSEVLTSKAKDHEVLVFPNAFWAEVSARYVRESYLDEKAVTLTLQLFEVAFEQFPKIAHVRPFRFFFFLFSLFSCI